MIKITNRNSIENRLFSRTTIRLFIISVHGGCGTQSNITHFVGRELKTDPSYHIYHIRIALAIFGCTNDIALSHVF